MTGAEELLKQWLIQLSGFVDGSLSPGDSLDTALSWYVELSPDEHTQIEIMRDSDKDFEEFFKLGEELLKDAETDD